MKKYYPKIIVLLSLILLVMLLRMVPGLGREDQGLTVKATSGDYTLVVTSDRVVYDRSKHFARPHFDLTAALTCGKQADQTITFSKKWWVVEVTGEDLPITLFLELYDTDNAAQQKSAIISTGEQLTDTWSSSMLKDLDRMKAGTYTIRISSRFLPDHADAYVTFRLELPFVVK